jgi:hypothetical protein
MRCECIVPYGTLCIVHRAPRIVHYAWRVRFLEWVRALGDWWSPGLWCCAVCAARAALRGGEVQPPPPLKYNDECCANDGHALTRVSCTNTRLFRTHVHAATRYEFPADLLNADYGEPLGLTQEKATGVFVREYSKATVQMDCNTYTPTFTFK